MVIRQVTNYENLTNKLLGILYFYFTIVLNVIFFISNKLSVKKKFCTEINSEIFLCLFILG